MSVALVLIFGALRLTCPANNNSSNNNLNDNIYHDFPRFWTHSGFCAANNSSETAFRPTEEIKINLHYISALPSGAVKTIRIHWLLELLAFQEYTPSGVPVYDFTNLDMFLEFLDELGLYPVIEFMGNPNGVFSKNPLHNEFYWENLSSQIVQRYAGKYGPAKILKWRFESWNEPDLRKYNRLTFNFEDYVTYVYALRRGLTSAGQRLNNSIHLPLHGPAGLFRSTLNHPLCWKILQLCNDNIKNCPFDTITYHRKGHGKASEVLEASSLLLKELEINFPQVAKLPIANSEADPIAIWSTPHDYLADVRYAATLVTIVLLHWSAKLQKAEFKQLSYISHDNAFISYHPYEFSQRTLLAHFRMNNSQPVYSQFIQKPVYSALGMLSKLGSIATDLEFIAVNNTPQIQLLKTKVPDSRLYLSWLMLPTENVTSLGDFILRRQMGLQFCEQGRYAYLIEILEQKRTDPAALWIKFGKPPYPNATVRETLRHSQNPFIYANGILSNDTIEIHLGKLELPWILLLRVCSNLIPQAKRPRNLIAISITKNEVMLTWRENNTNNISCIKTYEVWHLIDFSKEWIHVSKGWHLPHLSFHYAPTNISVEGFYKVRSIDAFNNSSEFSDIVEYIEI
ncbi:alpha-L-iduronidase [Teleopsis dalmanni]|uniref:alpha-L-iduronidase n=1 Tax=Teleopsis dalmanni TaxID=139649 RepID=UPI0018CECBCB|nr:alpha-L-iduronidase [Teleopsis dalmanni]